MRALNNLILSFASQMFIINVVDEGGLLPPLLESFHGGFSVVTQAERTESRRNQCKAESQ
jgi:hypothetical protein